MIKITKNNKNLKKSNKFIGIMLDVLNFTIGFLECISIMYFTSAVVCMTLGYSENLSLNIGFIVSMIICLFKNAEISLETRER